MSSRAIAGAFARRSGIATTEELFDEIYRDPGSLPPNMGEGIGAEVKSPAATPRMKSRT
jgi:hypothetical protein